ncbi:MAG: hypothetical protein ACXW2E_11560, partial [Nitrososphaeraceae archaeon]
VKNNFMTGAKKLADTFDIVKIWMKQTENALKTAPSPEELKLYSRDAIYGNAKAINLLNFKPSMSIEEGLKSTVSWLKTNKILTTYK